MSETKQVGPDLQQVIAQVLAERDAERELCDRLASVLRNALAAARDDPDWVRFMDEVVSQMDAALAAHKEARHA